MLNNSKKPRNCRIPASVGVKTLIAVSVLTGLMLSQSACFFKKKVKPETVAIAPVRLVLLPFNVQAEHKDLQWTSMAAPILMAKAAENASGLEILPLWQTMPTALNVAGTSRNFTEESASTVAAWMTAKWSVLGELTPLKNGVSMVVDFIPSRSNLVPFRYLKSGKLDSIGDGFQESYLQFLRYLVAKRFEPVRDKQATMSSVKDLAEALDREYGWSVEAEPGKAQEVVTKLTASDEKLARMLFSPTLYPILAEKK